MTLSPMKTPKTFAHRLASLQNRAWLPPSLLLLALSSVFLFGGDSGHYYQEDEHKKLAIAENLSIDHNFRLFIDQTLDADGKPTYAQPYERFPIGGYSLYGRFPIGGYSLIKLAISPFGDDLSAKIYAARVLMLLCFVAAAVLAYLSLCRLTSNRWIALTAALLAFSSPYLLYHSDVINTEITIDLFAVMLVFHGMAVFEQEGRFRQLLLKACIALLLGWHMYALLLPFIAFGLTRELVKTHSNASPASGALRQLRHLALSLIRSRYLALGVMSLLFGVSVLTFNFTNEYFALNREIPPTELPSFKSMTNRIGVGSYFKELPIHADYLAWPAFLERQFYRVGMITLPYAFSLSYVEDRQALPLLFVVLGIAVSGASLIGLLFIRRYKILLASLTLSGFCWALPMRYNVAYPWHQFEAVFYIGVTLALFSMILLYLLKISSERAVAALSVAALLIFVLSALRMSQLNNAIPIGELRDAAIDDFEIIRSMTDAGNVMQTIAMPKLYGRITVFAYYLSGRIGVHIPETAPTARTPDFVISGTRADRLSSLTPQNRMVFLYEWDDYYRRIDQIIEQAGAPLTRPGFGVYLDDNRLIYVKNDCIEDDTDTPFFLALYPVDQNDLPINRMQYGFDNLDFRFEEHAVLLGERCIAIKLLPDYDISRIYTGQFIQGVDGSFEHLWERDVSLNEAAR